MSTKSNKVTITLDNLDGLDLFFKLMRDDVNKALATQDTETIKAKLSEVQCIRGKMLRSYLRRISEANSRATQSANQPKKNSRRIHRPCYALELNKALLRISAEQFNSILAMLIAGLVDRAKK